MNSPKPDQPDHSGLQVVPGYDAPEVFSPPHSRPDTSYSDSPEVYNSSPYYAPAEKTSHYEHNSTNPHPYPYAGVNGSEYTSYPEALAAQNDQQADAETGLMRKEPMQTTTQRPSRMCGMRKKVFWWVAGAIILIIVIAAVLGGVLGSVLNNNLSPPPSSGSSPNVTSSPVPSTQPSTGLALNQLVGSSTTYSYYQDPSGRIIENTYANGQWAITGDDDVPSSAVVASNARKSSPIAATSYTSGSTVLRLVFFITSDGAVMTTNTTGTNAWQEPYNILSDDYAAASSVGLSVISDTSSTGLNGVRVYYASHDGLIREVGCDFTSTSTDPTWEMWAYFPQSDIETGVAAVLVGGYNHLYMRNASTGNVQQWVWNYIDVSQWDRGNTGPQNIAVGSDIAAATDGKGTDHVFYDISNNDLVHLTVASSGWSDTTTLATTASGTRLTATYLSPDTEAALVMYQPSNKTDAMAYQAITDGGNVVLSGVV